MKFKAVDALIEKDITQGFPGAQLCVSMHGQIIKNQGYGFVDYLTERRTPITTQTYFDIASLTKMLAIVYSFQYLTQYQGVQVTRPLKDIFTSHADFFAEDAANGGNKSDLTILNCLAHTAGFPANPWYYDPNYSRELYFQALDVDIAQNRQALLAKLLA